MPEPWPALSYASWSATCDTLHAHTQVLGKLAVALAPPQPQLEHAGDVRIDPTPQEVTWTVPLDEDDEHKLAAELRAAPRAVPARRLRAPVVALRSHP